MKIKKLRMPVIALAICLWGSGLKAQAGNPASGQDVISRFGPKNLDHDNFATIYLLRDQLEEAKDLWYGIFLDDLFYAKINHGEKYILKLHKNGPVKIWSKAETTSELALNIDFGKVYFLKLNLVHGGKHPNPELILLEYDSGKNQFESSKQKSIDVNYPVSRVRDIPKTNRKTKIEYYTFGESIQYGSLTLFVPRWANHVEYVPGVDWINMGYFDPLVSDTFSEIAQVSFYDEISPTDYAGFLSYLKKGPLKERMKKGDKLISEKQEELGIRGASVFLEYNVIHDQQAGKPHGFPYMEIDTFLAYLYLPVGGKAKVYRVLYSQRGQRMELRSYEELRSRAFDFFANIRVK